MDGECRSGEGGKGRGRGLGEGGGGKWSNHSSPSRRLMDKESYSRESTPSNKDL